MCSVFKTILYRRVKSAYIENITTIFNSNKGNFDDFIEQSMNFTISFTQCSKEKHHKSNRLFRYYLEMFYNNNAKEFHLKFFPRTKYYFGLSQRSTLSYVRKYSEMFM